MGGAPLVHGAAKGPLDRFLVTPDLRAGRDAGSDTIYLEGFEQVLPELLYTETPIRKLAVIWGRPRRSGSGQGHRQV